MKNVGGAGLNTVWVWRGVRVIKDQFLGFSFALRQIGRVAEPKGVKCVSFESLRVSCAASHGERRCFLLVFSFSFFLRGVFR